MIAKNDSSVECGSACQKKKISTLGCVPWRRSLCLNLTIYKVSGVSLKLSETMIQSNF